MVFKHDFLLFVQSAESIGHSDELHDALCSLQYYSYLNASTGLAVAALTA